MITVVRLYWVGVINRYLIWVGHCLHMPDIGSVDGGKLWYEQNDS